MTNTTETYWSADGQSLHTFARNIITLGGTDAPPALRGSNIDIPYAIGERYVPKYPGSRVISLAMWVRGATADGLIPTQGDQARQLYEDNWRSLRNLLWNQGRQIKLQKRFKIDGVTRVATALAEYSGGLEIQKIGRTAGKFTVDLRLADPYFYDEELVTKSLVTGDNDVPIRGDADTNHILVTINGARTNPLIRNKSLNTQVQYYDVLTVGSSTQLNIRDYTATTTPSGMPSFNGSGKVRHSGGPQWLMMKPGNNIVNLSSSSGLGVVSLQTRGAWL